jgi:hypothetical protein
MYRQGLGDCFLLTFFVPDADAVHMLIDCGTLGAKTTEVSMAEVAQNIVEETNGRLNVLIATHEHKDHVSGFSSQRAAFDGLHVDQVWVAWTENPADPLARQVKKYQTDLITATSLAANALVNNDIPNDDEKRALSDSGQNARQLLEFFGDNPDDAPALGAAFAKTVHEAMSYVTTRAGTPEFLEPGDIIEPDWLPGIRFYVLGPPRSKEALTSLGAHGSPELYGLVSRLSQTLGFSAGLLLSRKAFGEYRANLEPEERQRFEKGLPFDPRFRIEKDDPACATLYENYHAKEDQWRRIDYDWLAATSDLALQLDNATNNTSLVLAIEIINAERVLLFPADAQLGNWLSWHDLRFSVRGRDGGNRTFTVTELLRDTVFYKVGHHASHNATVREKGLELMKRGDLVAMIPVDRKVAMNKHPPWRMPADALYRRLLEKTRGRVLRSDTGWPDDDERPSSVSKTEWDQARGLGGVEVTDLYIDFTVQ